MGRGIGLLCDGMLQLGAVGLVVLLVLSSRRLQLGWRWRIAAIMVQWCSSRGCSSSQRHPLGSDGLLLQGYSGGCREAAGSSPATRSGNNRAFDGHTSTLLSPITIKEMR